MFKKSPRQGIVPGLFVVLLATHAEAQSPTSPPTTTPYSDTASHFSETPKQPRYTVPTDPAAEQRLKADAARTPSWPTGSQPWLSHSDSSSTNVASESLPTNGFPVQPVGHLQPITVKQAAADPFDVKRDAVEQRSSQTADEEPIDLTTVGNEVISVDYTPVEPLGVEPNPVCCCTPSARYRRDCPRCRNRVSFFPQSRAGDVTIGGWLEQGFTTNFGSPHDRRNAPLLFNDRSNDYRLNQFYFFAEKSVLTNGRDWDFGGRVDVLMGTDARFVTVPGLERHKDRSPKWNSETDDYGIAIPQAYVEVAAPWMSGVSLKAGHFYSIAGYETVAAPENFFYSHAYTFTYGEPFTHTGALLTTEPNDRVKFQLGGTTGWDVFDSVSDEWGVLAGVTLTSADERTSLAATMHSGQDVTSARVGGVLLEEDRHFYSLVLQHRINKCWRYVFQHDFGYQEGGELVVNVPASTITTDTAKWYGINQYLIHDINDQLSSALRVEWFRDQDHSRIGIPVTFNPGGPTFTGGNYVAVTGGFNWRPHSNVTIRPELRWDYSDLKGNGNAPGGDPNFRAFDDNTSSSQGTAALDVIVHY